MAFVLAFEGDVLRMICGYVLQSGKFLKKIDVYMS